MTKFIFEDNFYSKSSFIPEAVAEHFKASSWRKDDIALALAGTKIVSLRILEEYEKSIENVHHVVLPIETINSDGISLATPIRVVSEWVTLGRHKGDVSYRISLAFQDAISLEVAYKNPFVCLQCSDQLEECSNIYDEGGDAYALEPISILEEPWWEDSWDGTSSSTPRLFEIDVLDEALAEFISDIAVALAQSIERSSFKSMLANSDLRPLLMINHFWSELSEKAKVL